ncbi:hypothetical protein SAMN05660477_01166 [Soonwooa buanensis]|uniref:Uncharacterized protein n=1 Tax=Soonwooa buanensis TaxID=619805 RepID=A0A1T5E7D8_9FLAO|nr:hypothetical protein [Soonwooa buanensis]SKB79785.1 hypothetical protein SAMN05660477_01166 [Soonwooa buanensis]
MKKLFFAALFMTGGMVAVSAQTTEAKKAKTTEATAVEEVQTTPKLTEENPATTKKESDKSIIANDKKLKSKLNKEKAKDQPMLQEAEPAKQEGPRKIEKVE